MLFEKYPALVDFVFQFKHWILWAGIICSCIVGPVLAEVWHHKRTSLKQIGRTVLLGFSVGVVPLGFLWAYLYGYL